MIDLRSGNHLLTASGKCKQCFGHAPIENENTFISRDLTQWTEFQRFSVFVWRTQQRGNVEHWKVGKTWSVAVNKSRKQQHALLMIWKFYDWGPINPNPSAHAGELLKLFLCKHWSTHSKRWIVNDLRVSVDFRMIINRSHVLPSVLFTARISWMMLRDGNVKPKQFMLLSLTFESTICDANLY